MTDDTSPFVPTDTPPPTSEPPSARTPARPVDPVLLDRHTQALADAIAEALQWSSKTVGQMAATGIWLRWLTELGGDPIQAADRVLRTCESLSGQAESMTAIVDRLRAAALEVVALDVVEAAA